MAVDTDKGLITPVVTNADAKGLKQISSDMLMLRNKALEGKLTPEEYQVNKAIADLAPLVLNREAPLLFQILG